ncbi:hypothetical protein C8R47DRAFT_218711 [Mycena vitilis]|nr:hypothetical protein C8R47DRAFT_218711 [Mycena vitilis]
MEGQSLPRRLLRPTFTHTPRPDSVPKIVLASSGAAIAETEAIPAHTLTSLPSPPQDVTNSPIQSLPAELLGQIFHGCLPPTTYIRASCRLAPLLVSWVCKYWRRVALSEPALWSSLVLEPPYNPLYDSDHCTYLSQARFWLARSGRCRLSLAIQARDSLHHIRRPTHDLTAFLTIEGYLQRCSKVELNISITTEQLLHIFRHAFVLVEATLSDVQPSPHPRTRFIEVENLQVLDITTQVAMIEPLFNWVVLPQLRDLRITAANPHPDVWRAIISLVKRSQCRVEALAYISMQHSAIPTPIAEFMQHPVLTHLRHLVLRGVLVPPAAIKALTVSASRKPLLPMLTGLDLAKCCSRDGEFAAMVASRCTSLGGSTISPGSLQSVTVQFDVEQHDMDVSQLNALSSGGVTINIREAQ